ncbi:MAG: c-type cytochrome [Planctomycetes bacterium]|nr:c-type cytochrome [Planctomycetota bacterium]
MEARVVVICASFLAALWPSLSYSAEGALPKAPEGFEITLFGGPPTVNYPVCISAAPTGELFVGVDKQGSLGKKPGQGKILRCVDTDNDGKADKFTTFTEVDHPRGLAYDNGTLWVLHPPTLSVYFDDNRDGVADRSEVLVTGISTDQVKHRGADHTTNGIRLGIDGWIYIAVGDFGFVDAQGKDGKKLTLRGGGVARVRPDGTELEIYARGLRNIVDVCVDPRLNLFTRDNTNDGGGWDLRLSHIVQSAHYGYPSLFKNFDDEILRPLADYGGGSGCGGMFVSEPWLPKPYDDALLTCDWGRDRVYFHPLARDGATFSADQKFFLAIPRPTDIDADGLGHLYVSSWHNGEFSYSNENVGYVVQLRPKNNTAPAMHDLAKLDDATLVAELGSPSHVRRLHAQREILRRGERPTIVEPLIQLMRKGDSLDARIAAVFAYKQLMGAKATAELVSLTADADIREYALRALTDRTTQLEGVPTAPFVTGLNHANPRVQVAALVGLARLANVEAAPHILPLTTVTKPADVKPAVTNNKQKIVADPARVVPHVAIRSLVALQAVDACLAALDGPYRDGAHRALRWMHDPRVVDGLVARLEKTSDPQARQELLATLVRLYHREGVYKGSWWNTRPDTTGPYYDRVKWEGTPKIEAVLRGQLTSADSKTVERLLRELTRHRIALGSLPGGLVQDAQRRETEAKNVPLTIPQVDPKNPKQLGNIPWETILAEASGIKGDVGQGADLFKRQGCIACHAIAPGQAPIGPQLLDIGRRYNRQQLVESIVKPSATIAQGFATNRVDLKSGLTQSGFIVREAADEVELRTTEGKSLVVPKSEIEERSESKVSAMPEGLVGNLTVEELASLIAFLESLKSP